jgi:plasmid maintenance system antidote protein VapI
MTINYGYDAEPLLAIARTRALEASTNLDRDDHIVRMADALGVSTRNVHRWLNGATIRAHVADRCAVNLGLHIDLIWP